MPWRAFGIIEGTKADRDAKRLRKKYRSFDADMARTLAALEDPACVTNDDAIQGFDRTVFKRRSPCSDSQSGKSGGYRIVYYVWPSGSAVLAIFHKSERENVTTNDLAEAIASVARSFEDAPPDECDA